MTILALQVDSRGVTALLASRAKGGATERLGLETVAWHEEPEKLAAALQAALPGLSRPEVSVALGPESIRVRSLSVPPAPEAEMPAIVAMQAAREAAADTESLVVDYAPPTEQSGVSQTLAAWASVETLEFWRRCAERLGGRLVVATPRPLATQVLEDPDALVATRAGDALDFAASTGHAPVLIRSTRTADDASERELQRTRLALGDANLPLVTDLPLNGDRPIDWAGHPEELGVPTDDLHDCAAAAGLLLHAVYESGPSLNLADPRRAPVEETNHRRLALLSAAAASVLLAGAWMAYDRVASLDRQIKAKRAEIAEAREDAEAFDTHRQRVAALDAWRATDVVWLDELDRLAEGVRPKPLDAEDFPAERDVRLTRLAAAIATGRGASGGKIDVTALLKTPSVDDLEARFREAERPLGPKTVGERPAEDAYRYQYTADLRVPASTSEEEAP